MAEESPERVITGPESDPELHEVKHPQKRRRSKLSMKKVEKTEDFLERKRKFESDPKNEGLEDPEDNVRLEKRKKLEAEAEVYMQPDKRAERRAAKKEKRLQKKAAMPESDRAREKEERRARKKARREAKAEEANAEEALPQWRKHTLRSVTQDMRAKMQEAAEAVQGASTKLEPQDTLKKPNPEEPHVTTQKEPKAPTSNGVKNNVSTDTAHVGGEKQDSEDDQPGGVPLSSAIPAAATTDVSEEKKERQPLTPADKKAKREAHKARRQAEKEAYKIISNEQILPNGQERKSRKRIEREAREAARLEREAAREEAAEKAEKVVNGDAEKTIAGTDEKDLIKAGEYTEHPALTSTPQDEIDAFMKANTLVISDNQSLPLKPILDFKQLPHTNLLYYYVLEKFHHPTVIQSSAWPYAFAGRDVVGVAETGSGKTLAFGMPLARHITTRLKKGNNGRGTKRSPFALVVSPTRELAVQIYEQLARLGQSNAFGVACVYGGVAKELQTPKLRKAHCVVATPGRLRDYMMEMRKPSGIIPGDKLDLSRVKYVVLDEADRMLDTGFEEDIRAILGACALEGRQTMMFTATWPQSIRQLASSFMTDPVKITIGDRDDLRANERIKQVIEVIEPREKNDRLLKLLNKHTKGSKSQDRILVFCLYKKEAARIEEYIYNQGFTVGGIHGDLSQQKRTDALEAFKSGNVPILVATDVAARGLDIPAVKLVLNVTFPLTVEDYVHRIGRTGRAGQDGLAITLFTANEKGLAGALINVLKAANQEVPEQLLQFGTTVKKKQHDVYGRFVKDGMEGQIGTKTTFD